MISDNKNAIIYGACRAIGSADIAFRFILRELYASCYTKITFSYGSMTLLKRLPKLSGVAKRGNLYG